MPHFIDVNKLIIFVFCAVCLGPRGATGQSPTKKAEASPEEVAQAMAKNCKSYLRYSNPVNVDLGQVVRLLKAATDATGVNLDGIKMTSEEFNYYMLWINRRRPWTPEVAARYETRFKTIDKATLGTWQATTRKIGDGSESRVLLIAAIAFQDSLFHGSEWAQGNPRKALARLGSIPRDVVSRWKEAVKAGRPEGAGDEYASYASWSLIAVDELFLKDTFQPQVFDAAFAIAQKLLVTP